MADLTRLKDFLSRIPDVKVIVASEPDEGEWWIALKIKLGSSIAWNIVQELAYVCNALSLTAKLPVVFKPTSPPPYMNGGPREFLKWRIEALTPAASPDQLADYLADRMPKPVDDRSKWGDIDNAVPPAPEQT